MVRALSATGTRATDRSEFGDHWTGTRATGRSEFGDHWAQRVPPDAS